MVEKVDRFKAHDGREFLTREAALRHEAVEAMISAIPELALIRTRLEASMNQISVACEPLARFLGKTTLEVQPETTLEVRCSYAHPTGSRCPACQDVPKNVTVIPRPEARARG